MQAAVVEPDFPRLHALTQGWSLGRPRSFTLRGERLLFLRGAADDPVQQLWVLDRDGERLLADADTIAPHTAGRLTPEEQARRERARERGSGIVAYSADGEAEQVVLTLGGKLIRIHVPTAVPVQLAVDGPVVDPRLDPTGSNVAYVEEGALWTVRADGTNAPRMLAHDRHPNVTWGLAEFVAGEEMGRTRGFWWSPDGQLLIAARVDTTPVREWWIAAPVDPQQRPRPIRYPAAGTPNAQVSLALVGLNGEHTPVRWDVETYPYLADVVWSGDGPVADDGAASPVLVVQSRDQQQLALIAVSPSDGSTSTLVEDRDQPWIELVGGSPTFLSDGRMARVVQQADRRRVCVTSPGAHDADGILYGPGQDDAVDLMVTSILGGDADEVLVTAHPTARPWAKVLAALRPGGVRLLSEDDGVAAGAVTPAPDGGVRMVLAQRSAQAPGMVHTLREPDGSKRTIRSRAADQPALPVRTVGPLGGDGTPVSVLHIPVSWQPGDAPLPVLVDSYGGPHAQRVIGSAGSNAIAEWFAANGYAVLTTDGPGAPGQSLTWEAAIAGDFATGPLQGQIDALERADEDNPGLFDRSRVAIRGWSFGGYLAALAVLRRPDVFQAAIAGAPVTDWGLYDTYYTERYLGHPDVSPEAYERSSLLPDAANLSRPLLLIHGLADDNVVVAHALRLSRALLEAGAVHEVLPLSGVTHFTPSATINANLALHQLEFLRRAVG